MHEHASGLMSPTSCRIPARSRRQAMDWSLALVSQGIETTIEHSGDGTNWGLLVSAQDSQSALRTLKLYHLENRGWPWQHHVFRPGLVFDWASIAWALLAALFYGLSTATDLETPGLMDSIAVIHGQWWRLFTAIWLHADLAHLGTNLVIGLVLMGLAMGCYGTGAALLAAGLAGAAGNLVATLFAAQQHLSRGSSGMVMGALGLIAAQSFSLLRQTPKASKFILSGVLGGLMLFVLLGLTPGTDVLAHAGGFAGGLLIGGILACFPKLSENSTLQFTWGGGFVLLVLIPWWIALHTVTPN